MSHSYYRRDIDGLRAIAILPVVAYHAGLPWFSGGFVGVDIFFVISGFLITGIVARDIRKGNFSILTFYERRARRIFPALFAMLGACVLVAPFVLMPRAFQSQFESLISTVFFWSNFHFWVENSNYFAGASELMPLLHTWSLAVEEQFYILFPPLLYAVIKFTPRLLTPLLIAAVLGSLAIAEVGVRNAPTLTFFASPTRAWELLAGAGLALGIAPRISSKLVNELSGLLGLGLIAWAILTYSTATRFPGLAAIPPCLGAALLIWSGTNSNTWCSRLLSIKPLVGIGLISYSLYLWHWPVLVFAKHLSLGSHLGAEVTVALIALGFILAWLSWRYIEQPFRIRVVGGSQRTMFQWSAAGIFILSCASLYGSHMKGWPDRYPGYESLTQTPFNALPDRLSACFVRPGNPWGSDQCFIGGTDSPRPNAMLIGDSHAMHLVYGLMEYEESADHDILVYTKPSCPPIPGYFAASNPECTSFNDQIERVADEHQVDVLILSGAWWSYVNRGRLTLESIHDGMQALCSDRRCLLVGQSPVFSFEYPNEYFYGAFRDDLGAPMASADITYPESFNAQLRDHAGDHAFVSPMLSLCDGGNCVFRLDDAFLFADSSHLTPAGSKLVAAQLIEALGNLALGSSSRAQLPVESILPAVRSSEPKLATRP